MGSAICNGRCNNDDLPPPPNCCICGHRMVWIHSGYCGADCDTCGFQMDADTEGRRLMNMREKIGLTRRQFCEQIGNITPTTLKSYEWGYMSVKFAKRARKWFKRYYAQQHLSLGNYVLKLPPCFLISDLTVSMPSSFSTNTVRFSAWYRVRSLTISS